MKNKFSKIYPVGVFALAIGLAVACSEEEPLNMAPTFNLNEVTNVMRTTATFNGSISGDYNHISEYGFQYSQSQDFTANLTEKAIVGQKPSSSLCQITVTGLEADKRYYYRLYATTGATTVYSDSEYFQTDKSSAPVMLPLEVDSIGESSARFRCTIQDIGDEHLLEYGVGYKQLGEKNFAPVASDSIIPESIAGAPNTFYLEINGLSPATRYVFRPYAKNSSSADGNSGSREGYGDEVEKQTENLLSAEVETNEVNDGHIGINSIDVSATIKSAIGSNGVIDKVGFCWSEKNTYPVITDESVELDPVKVGESFKTTLTDLKPDTEYYVRAWAKNTVNGETRVGYGIPRTVVTNNLGTPRIEWKEGEDSDGYWISAYEVTANSIHVRATIKNFDENAIVEKGFIWDESSGELSLGKAKDNGNFLQIDVQTGGKEMDATITNLKLAKRYFVCAYAVYRAAGLEETGYSQTYEINTRDFEAPNLSSTEVKDVTRKTATLIGGMSSEGNATIVKKGFCLINTNYGEYYPEINTENAIVVWADDDSFTETVENLTPASGYYVRSFAVTEIGELRTDTTYSWSTNHFSTSDIEHPVIDSNGMQTDGGKVNVKAYLYSVGEGEIVERGFIWKPDSVGGDMTLENCSSGIATGDNDLFTYTIDGLAYQTSYNVKPYVKSVVENDTVVTYAYWSYGIYMDYSYPEVESPTIEDDAIGLSSAKLKSNFINSGSFDIVKKGFCIHLAETTSEPSLNNNLYVLEADDSFSATLTDLEHNTRYSVRTFATYQKDGVEETVYSYYRTFTTKGPDSYTFNNLVNKSDSTTITSLYYTCGVAEEGEGEVIEKGFIWKQRPKDAWSWQYPTFEDDVNDSNDGYDGFKAVEGGTLNDYSLMIAGLKPSTTYYVRSYVKVMVEEQEYVYYSGTNQNNTSSLPVSLNFTVFADSCSVTGTVTGLPEGTEDFGLCYSSDHSLSVDEMVNTVKAVKADDFTESNAFTVGIGELAESTEYKVGFYFKMGDEYIVIGSEWWFTTKRLPSVNDNVSPGKKEE